MCMTWEGFGVVSIREGVVGLLLLGSELALSLLREAEEIIGEVGAVLESKSSIPRIYRTACERI